MNTTTVDDMARGVPDQPDQAALDAEARVATSTKAAERVREVIERVEMITNVIGPLLSKMAAESPLGDAVDAVSIHNGLVEDLEKAVAGYKAKVAFAKEVSMPERMDRDKATTFNTEAFRVTRTSRVLASIISEQVEAAFQWLRDNEFGSLIKETVNASSLSSAAKELIERGFELPEEQFRVHTKDSISITKKKK